MISNILLYDKSVEIYFDDIKHKYTLAEGNKEITSVTKALGIINKPALVNWASNMAVDSAASQIEPGKSYDEIQLDTIFKAARAAHYNKKTDAGTVGTFVHRFVEQTIKGENPPLPVNEQLRISCERFLKWVKDNNVKFLLSEQMVYSKLLNYVGTLDFVCKMDGKLYLGDLKTSSGIWDEYKLQVAAYRYARSEEFTNEKYDGQLIIRIGKDGDFEVKTFEGDEIYHTLFNGFVNALELYRSMEEIKQIK